MARVVHITFFSDTLEGSKLVQLGNHVCQLYDLMRDDDNVFKAHQEELDTPALYILLNRKTEKAYIGQTDCFIQRIAPHFSRKEFWDEVLVFIASDGSINATEVQYLEATAYNVASEAGVFDLSENSQIPKPHKISQLAKYNAQDFFNVVRDLAKIVGCDIFISKPKGKKTLAKAQLTTESIKKSSFADADTLKGTGIKIYLNGKGPYAKGRFPLEVIREYLKRNPSATCQQLKDLFPSSLLGTWGRWGLIEPDIEKAKNLVINGESKHLRHFLDKESILTAPGDLVPFVVSSQWDYTNLPNILSKVEEFGWTYKILPKK